MNEKASSALQKAQQERKRGQFPKAIKRLEQAIEAFPDEVDLYVEAIDVCIDGGELLLATSLLKVAQEKFTKDRDRISGFIRNRLQSVHDPSLARCVLEHAVKRRDLEAAFAHLADVPDHVVRDLLSRAKTKKQSLKSASHGGYSLRGEQMTNELTSVLLAARLGQMKEAMATLVQVLEEKPVEHKIIDPFLASLETVNPKSGRVRFARACSLRASGLEADAIARFLEAARLDPVCAGLCTEQLKAMRENAKHPAKVERGLAESLLIKGDLADAATVLQNYAAANPENGREVIMLLRPYIDPEGGINPCTWLAIDVALKIEQSNVALDILRPLHQRKEHNHEIFAWLEERSKDGFFSTEVMMFHGSLAIEENQLERAAEILSAVCATSPNDSHAVLALIDSHRTAHPALEALFAKYAEPEGTTLTDAPADFQMFDNREFHLGGGEGPEAAPRAGSAPPSRSVPKKGLMDAMELSLDDSTGSSPEPSKPSAPAEPAAPPEPPAPAPAAAPERRARPRVILSSGMEITEGHVNRVAQKLHEAGAAAFFHVDAAAILGSDPGGEDPGARFADGALDAGGHSSAPPSIVDKLERAAEDGQPEELFDLLDFAPVNEAEEFARSFYTAEYQLMSNRPLQALSLFAKLDTPALSDDRKQRVWLKIAVCQRAVRDFAAAGQTLDRLLQVFPGVAAYEQLAQRNREQHFSEQSSEAPVLEKTTSLD